MRPRRLQRALPFAARRGDATAGQIFEAQRRLDHAGDEVGALHVAGEPEQIVGRSREHHRSSSSTTQVSLVPPPWLELTTNEPLVSATRVRPPGTIFTPFAPDRTKGLRSTWRGETPLSNEAGHVESASVGWAM